MGCTCMKGILYVHAIIHESTDHFMVKGFKNRESALHFLVKYNRSF